MVRGLSFLFMVAGALSLGLSAGCLHHMNHDEASASRRDINAVLADHDKELMAMPGVVGVYVGVLQDQRSPCLKVMLARKDSALEKKIPRSLEGYPVVTEVTGKITPMKE